MKSDVPEIAKRLAAKRRSIKIGRRELAWVSITAQEREQLYDIAKKRDLLKRYEFSGTTSYGVNRNDAARRLLEETHQKALRLFRREFGSVARFWFRPPQLQQFDVCFYWKAANIAVAITGPLRDDPYRGDPSRSRESSGRMEQIPDRLVPQHMRGVSIIHFPYYIVWHNPTSFIARVRNKLVETGRYPKLMNS